MKKQHSEETNKLLIKELQKTFNKFTYSYPKDELEFTIGIKIIEINGELRTIIKSVQW